MKSVRMRYLLTFLTIVLVAFGFLWLVIHAIVLEASTNEKTQTMNDRIKIAHTCVQNAMLASGEDDLSKLVGSRGGLVSLLSGVVDDYYETSVFLFDRDGRLLYSAGSMKLPKGTMLDSEEIAKLNDSSFLTEPESLSVLPEGTAVIRTETVYGIESESGMTVRGLVVVCSYHAEMTRLDQLMTNTVLTCTVIVMLFTMIIVSLISWQITQPLAAMSHVAKEYAKGHFDERIPVRGKDEIAQLGEALNTMAEDLSHLDKMRSSFISNVSHELRTPMTSISGFVESIIDGVIPPEKEKEYLQVILSEVRRLSRLVSSLLDLSRMESGERKLNPKPFDICEMGRQILISFEKKIDDKHLDVSFECDDDRMTVVADQDAIHQIFYNLCDNAIKFSFEKGKLAVSIRYNDEKKVQVTVFNEGQGIPPEDQPFIFDRFFKADKSRSLDKSGLGLGMYIAHNIITSHGEKIWLESEYGKNCRFDFTLPPQKG